jgi:hypothetical protein
MHKTLHVLYDESIRFGKCGYDIVYKMMYFIDIMLSIIYIKSNFTMPTGE